jgi:hypothetical protein
MDTRLNLARSGVDTNRRGIPLSAESVVDETLSFWTGKICYHDEAVGNERYSEPRHSQSVTNEPHVNAGGVEDASERVILGCQHSDRHSLVMRANALGR